jgi:hypothetical protein
MSIRLSFSPRHATIRALTEEACVSFIQIIEFSTQKIEEVQKVLDEFRDTRRKTGGPAPTRALICRDRDRENVYMNVVEFPSYEVAMENSKRPDTTELSQRLAALADGPPKFLNLDVIRDETI